MHGILVKIEILDFSMTKSKMNTYKIVVVGDEAIGKTTLVAILAGTPVPVNYTPTLGVEVDPTRCLDSIFNLWDCAGNPAFGGLREGYWCEAQGMIVVHRGVISQTSRNKAEVFRAMNPRAPIIDVNKTLVLNREAILGNFI